MSAHPVVMLVGERGRERGEGRGENGEGRGEREKGNILGSTAWIGAHVGVFAGDLVVVACANSEIRVHAFDSITPAIICEFKRDGRKKRGGARREKKKRKGRGGLPCIK